MINEDLRYPVGVYRKPEAIGAAEREGFVEEIAATPVGLRSAVRGLADSQMDTAYRDGGWTVRQVVHHLPDSHLNAYVRFKLALTEEQPLIRTYEESLWAELPEARSAPVGMSLVLLEAVHTRWVASIRCLPAAAFERTYPHPVMGLMSLNEQLAHYAWHGRHHIAHITALRRRLRWDCVSLLPGDLVLQRLLDR
jgi:uncharacterized damage-inducible protein DinB